MAAEKKEKIVAIETAYSCEKQELFTCCNGSPNK